MDGQTTCWAGKHEDAGMISPRNRPREGVRLAAVWLNIWMLLLVSWPAPASRAADRVTDAAVDDAIRNAVTWLKAQRNESGHWETHGEKSMVWAGDTGLTLLALLYAGENPLADDMVTSLEWLASQELSHTYTVGTRAHVLALVPQRKYARHLQRDVDWLAHNIGAADSAHPGAYDYKGRPTSRYDNSNSQYGVLGVWMGTDAGATVANTYWELVAGHWMGNQNGDGGWGYDARGRSTTGSMTAAGLASLYVALDRLYVDRPREAVDLVATIDRGLDWYAREFTVDNPHGDEKWKYYYLYGIERVGRASGQKYFREIDWFREGAAFLLGEQRADGSWPGGGAGQEFTASDLRNTSFGLMFLCHGRAPVLFNKLEHEWVETREISARESRRRGAPRRGEEARRDDERPRSRWGDEDEPNAEPGAPSDENVETVRVSDWNNKMRDVAGLTRYTARSLERLVNWQIVRLDGSLADLMEAPVLYMCGRLEWQFSDAEVAKLREYCRRGGMILGVADHNSQDFAQGFRALATRMFPEYALEKLPPDHPLFNGDVRSPIDDPPEIYEMNSGLRTLMLLSTRDIAEAWHKYHYRNREKDFQLGVNIFLYATDKTTQRSRLKGPYIERLAVDPVREINVARIKYDGAWNPEPYGWDRLANYMNNQAATRLVVENGVELDSPRLREFKVAHITGNGAFELSEEELDGLQRFLTRGGTLLADATGGAGQFADALDTYLTKALRSSAEPAPHKAAIVSGDGIPDAVSLEGVAYRRAARREAGGRGYPRLMTYNLKRNAAALVSPLDLSSGLLGTDVYDCRGYDGDSSLRIMRNMLLYADLSAVDKAKLGRD